MNGNYYLEYQKIRLDELSLAQFTEYVFAFELPEISQR